VASLISTYCSSGISSSFLGFRHESVVTVREFYTECNARFRWSERLLIYLTQLLLAIFT
jgi:hypothetical protein